MAGECPGATASPARPSESGAEETAEADLLASASRRALPARRRMTVAGPTPALARTSEPGWRHAKAGRKYPEEILRERRRQCRHHWDAGWCA
eukprot:27389-Pleurochrysis_carterae.AAC.1